MFYGLGSSNPDERHEKAKAELMKAEIAYSKAEDALIKARRNEREAYSEWRKFHNMDLNK